MFRGMEYVYAVYKEKSFSKAADKLFISQPSLSANVKRVEDSIGYPIFDRSTKPISLTEPGKKYIQTVERILSFQNEFIEYINDLGNLKTGSLILGGSSLFSSWILPSLMGAFTEKYPQVHMELLESNSVKLERMLQDGEVDLILDNRELDPDIFDHQLLRKEYLVLAVPKRFEINNQLTSYQIPPESIRDLSFLDDSYPVVDLNLFSEEPFILLKHENDTRFRAMELCRQANFTPNIIFELDQQMTTYNITCSGLGISFISNTLISHVSNSDDILYYKLDIKTSSRYLYFYWKKGRYLNKVMQRFLELARV